MILLRLRLKMLSLLISLLLLSSQVLSLRCWNGVDSVASTQYAAVGQTCLRYYNCKNGWVNGQCSVTPTWNYLSYDAGTWSNVFNNKYNLNLTACSTDYCNGPLSAIRCYNGYDTPPQLTTNVGYCYAYKQKCTVVGGPCSYVDVTYNISKIWYGTASSCPGITGTQCCTTDLCNNMGYSSNGIKLGLTNTLIILWVIILLYF